MLSTFVELLIRGNVLALHRLPTIQPRLFLNYHLFDAVRVWSTQPLTIFVSICASFVYRILLVMQLDDKGPKVDTIFDFSAPVSESHFVNFMIFR